MRYATSELPHVKLWRLRDSLRRARKSLEYCKTHKGGLHRLMIEHLTGDIAQLEGELARRKKCVMLKTANEWLAEPNYKGIVVLDPDGWDRMNYDASWAEKITEAEFNKRLAVSTCLWPRELLAKAARGEIPDGV